MLHGFTGAPYEMRDLGEFLAARGITVVCPAAAGHGTHHRDMAETSWRDWYASARAGLEELKGLCGKVFIAGLSMGGLQVLHLATHDRTINGAVAMGAPVFVRDPLIFLLLPIVKHTPLKYLYKFHKKRPNDIKDPVALKEHKSYSYVPVSCVSTLLEYMSHVRQDLKEITAPLLLIQSREDHTVPPENADVIFKEVGSSDKELVWLDNSYHVVTKDFDKHQVFERIHDFVRQRA